VEAEDDHEGHGRPVVEVQPVVAGEAQELLVAASQLPGSPAASDRPLGEGEPEDEAGENLKEEGQEGCEGGPVEERGSAHTNPFLPLALAKGSLLRSLLQKSGGLPTRPPSGIYLESGGHPQTPGPLRGGGMLGRGRLRAETLGALPLCTPPLATGSRRREIGSVLPWPLGQ